VGTRKRAKTWEPQTRKEKKNNLVENGDEIREKQRKSPKWEGIGKKWGARISETEIQGQKDPRRWVQKGGKKIAGRTKTQKKKKKAESLGREKKTCACRKIN